MRLVDPEPLRAVPPGVPPETLITPNVRETAVLVSLPLLRSYLWANAILRAGLESSVVLPSKFTHFSAGFVWLREELRREVENVPVLEDGFVFGGAVLIEDEGPQTLVTLRVGEQVIPVAVNRGRFRPHGCPPHPTGGSGTCWVKKNTANPPHWKYGILTCRHVVTSAGLGATIPLNPSGAHASPSSAIFAEETTCTIDAAVLEVPAGDWPTGLTRLPLMVPAAPGQLIELLDHTGRANSGKVLQVFHFGTYLGNLLGQRVIADVHGVPGDSGSLLTAAPGGEGVGIYMGAIPDGTGKGYDGMYQDLWQASAYFEFDPYL
jgi:hypothetical protein